MLSVVIWSIFAAGAVEFGQSRIALAMPESESAAEALPQLTAEEGEPTVPVVSAPEVSAPAGGVQNLAQPAIAPQVAAPTAVRQQQPVAQLNSAYVLGPGDTIHVEIFNVPEYSGSQQVLADGSINLAAISPVNVNGLTPQEAEKAISAAYRSELRYPQITVVLEAPRPMRVAIAGEVGAPGLYTLTPQGDAQIPTVAQAIQAAGGVTQAANLRNVQLRRANAQGGTEATTLNLWALLNQGDVRQDLPLRDGDAIVIGETDTVDLAETNRLSASNLSSAVEQDMVVAVVGEVFRPGAYEFGGADAKGRTTVTQAVQTAGGIKPSADIQRIQVRRLTRSGAEQLIDIDFWQLLQQGDLSQDLVLQQGDTVIIPEARETTPDELSQIAAANFSPEGVKVNVVGEVASPGQLQVLPNTTLNQAVLAAGGFTTRSTETVELIRVNPNGSVTQRQIEVDLSEALDSEKNPLLLNNDVVLVGRNGRARFGDSLGSVLGPMMQLLAPFRLFF
ncbi:MAG: SLBB domain-containing protein [Cyanobacteria bacterium J06626_6]